MDDRLQEYQAEDDQHARGATTSLALDNLDAETVVHNAMRSYFEVSEWLGDGATAYGSHNGYVSRKVSMAWLFDAIRAIVTYKQSNSSGKGDRDIYPLDVDRGECFLAEGKTSDCGVEYDDHVDLDQMSGNCATQYKQRSDSPNTNGTLKVRGNAWFYGERGYFYTHNSFIGECRFFHNARFLGQTTFDKEINGTAMRARWADLAEYRRADRDYPPGTLLMIGGPAEFTVSDGWTCNAIATTRPGLVLNGGLAGGENVVGIALTGTVPVRIWGRVDRFDRLVPSHRHPGLARKRRFWEFWRRPIGVALADGQDGMVDCLTRLSF